MFIKKINVTCQHICIWMHMHTHKTWITKSNTVTSIVKRIVDFKASGTKTLTPLLHRKVLLPSPWAWKLSQKLQHIRSLDLQEIWSPFLPPDQHTLFHSTVSRCKPPTSKKFLSWNVNISSKTSLQFLQLKLSPPWLKSVSGFECSDRNFF